MIRPCNDADVDTIYAIINDAAQAYYGVIPADRWHVPYMSQDELRREIESGVRFWGWDEGGELLGVMGIQDVQDVTLIRHAYVRTANRGQGIGGKLLGELRELTTRPVLIGTWAAATWAIRFYEKHGFSMVTKEEKDRLLKQVLVDPRTTGRDFGGVEGGVTKRPVPALLGKTEVSGLRDTIVNANGKGLYSTRQATWKPILGRGGGGST